jgi:starch synthase
VARVTARAQRLRVLTIASELSPWAKTGGLADVAASLPAALDALGHHVTIVVPRYRGIDVGGAEAIPWRVDLGVVSHAVTFQRIVDSDVRTIVFVDEPALFDRPHLYGDARADYPDNARRFALLSAAALEYAEQLAAGAPDIVHGHDWQAGLALAMLAATPTRWPKTSGAGRVFTIHNLAYQGLFPRESVPDLGLPWSVFSIGGAEFWGSLSFLKAGINFSDMLTTVSPQYARETLRPGFGAGMDGILAARSDRYVGILNGIDVDVWNPATDPLIPAPFDRDRLDGKRICKRALLARMRLPQGDDALRRPLVGMVSRLVEQKGIDLVVDAAEALVKLDATWVFVGSGEARFEQRLLALAAAYPTRVATFIGFDEAMAHLVEAGADMFLMPSKFEPCGLNQMYSLRYGTVPIVHAVGGLDDTIRPYSSRGRRPNGFKFRPATAPALAAAVRQAVRVYQDADEWRRLMREGMAADHSWGTSAREYVKVYRRARLAAAGRSAPAT